MKKFIAIIGIFTLLFVSACGHHHGGRDHGKPSPDKHGDAKQQGEPRR